MKEAIQLATERIADLEAELVQALDLINVQGQRVDDLETEASVYYDLVTSKANVQADLAEALADRDAYLGEVRKLQVELEGYRALRLLDEQRAPRFDELSELDERIASILRAPSDFPTQSEGRTALSHRIIHTPEGDVIQYHRRANDDVPGAKLTGPTTVFHDEDMAQKILDGDYPKGSIGAKYPHVRPTDEEGDG